jgi:K+-transporting ATPase KdpF subunit
LAALASGSSTNQWKYSSASETDLLHFAMMIALFVLALATFCYLSYVLLRPERF